MLRVIAATRRPQADFGRETLLGRSLPLLLARPGVCACIAASNTSGLPQVFNTALSAAADEDVVVFTHDDAALRDWFLPERLTEALDRFDLVGVAGNRRRLPRQPGWIFPDERLTRDHPDNLSGAVVHGEGTEATLSWYGPSPASVRLLDGVFLAAKVDRLRRAGVRFDVRFPFHLYDLDFCRSCERAGLRLGTWPIAVSHASVGSFRSAAWRQAYADYLAKWGE